MFRLSRISYKTAVHLSPPQMEYVDGYTASFCALVLRAVVWYIVVLLLLCIVSQLSASLQLHFPHRKEVYAKWAVCVCVHACVGVCVFNDKRSSVIKMLS